MLHEAKKLFALVERVHDVSNPHEKVSTFVKSFFWMASYAMHAMYGSAISSCSAKKSKLNRVSAKMTKTIIRLIINAINRLRC